MSLFNVHLITMITKMMTDVAELHLHLYVERIECAGSESPIYLFGCMVA